MGLEIERKFLVKQNMGEVWQKLASPILFRQAYLMTSIDKTIRVRIEGCNATLTIKTSRYDSNVARNEWEYDIPLEDAQSLIAHATDGNMVEKYRYRINHEGKWWEVDEFLGLNAGLVVAEIELESESESFSLPDWVGDEVTHDRRYLNANLISHPFAQW